MNQVRNPKINLISIILLFGEHLAPISKVNIDTTDSLSPMSEDCDTTFLAPYKEYRTDFSECCLFSRKIQKREKEAR
jgi:hypothetical protein